MNESQETDGNTPVRRYVSMAARALANLPPRGRRVVNACILLFVLWLVFLKIVPRFMVAPYHPAPPPAEAVDAFEREISHAVTPAPQPIAAEPAPPMVQKPADQTPAATEPAAPAPAAPVAPAAPPPTTTTDTSLESLQSKVAAQSEAIATLQHQQEHSLHTIMLLDAYDRLKERVLSGRSYTEELNRLHSLAANDSSLAAPLTALETYAASGIPPLDALQRSFGEAARKALHPAPQADAGIMARLSASLSQIISIRRVGEVQGNSAEATIARAEAALDRQDVEQAIAELAKLQGPAMHAMQPWISKAKAYATRDAMLASLRTAILVP